jgi:hypothetical protein
VFFSSIDKRWLNHNLFCHEHSVLDDSTVRPVRIGIFQTCGKDLHERIISLRGDVWVNKTSLNLPLFIEVFLPSQKVNGHLLVC